MHSDLLIDARLAPAAAPTARPVGVPTTRALALSRYSIIKEGKSGKEVHLRLGRPS